MQQLTVSANPHIRAPRTTRGVMADVLIALSPAAVAGVVLFGWRSLLVMLVCVASAVLSEWLFQRITHQKTTIGDLSAVVTGLILALNLPSTIPLWQAMLGSVVAIVVAKCLFGGIGCNFANPAIVGRIALFVSFTSSLSTPTSNFSTLFGVDMVSGATPLTSLNEKVEMAHTIPQLLLGTYGGMIGETCAVALLIGFVYLLCRRVISFHIPVAFMGTVALFALCCGRDPLVELLSGGLLLGAIFMATDYVTSPDNAKGKLVFGVGCGLITMFIRVFCTYPEGVSFAILLMNILCPYIEKLTENKPVGGAKA